jgi:hypothetical protein
MNNSSHKNKGDVSLARAKASIRIYTTVASACHCPSAWLLHVVHFCAKLTSDLLSGERALAAMVKVVG